MAEQKGSILVLTVMSVTLLMILGVSFLTLASAEFALTSVHAQSLQAFYAAEAGLNWGRQYLSVNIATIVPNPGALAENAEFTLAFPGSTANFGSTTVKLQKQGSNWKLISTSSFSRARQEVSQAATVVAGSATLPDFTMFLAPRPAGTPSSNPQGVVTLAGSGTTITGDLPVYGVVNYQSVGQDFPHWLPVGAVVDPPILPIPTDGGMGIYTLPPFSFPALPSRGNLIIDNRTDTINSPGWYGNVTISGNPCALTIDARAASFTQLNINALRLESSASVTILTGSHDLEIRLNSYTGNGQSRLTIEGTGNVRMYVNQQVTLSGTSYLNYSSSGGKKPVYTPGNSEQLTFYYYGTNQLTIGGDTHLCGSLVSGPAPLHLKSNEAVIGHVVSGTTGTITIGPDGGSDRHVTGVVYAPNARVILDSGRVTGAIVAASSSFTGIANLHMSSAMLTSFSSFFIEVGGTIGGGVGGGGGSPGGGGGDTTITFGSWQGR